MKKSFEVKGLHCVNCALRLEGAVNRIDGVEDAVVSFATQKLVIEAPEDKMDAILDKAQEKAKKLDPDWVIVR